MDLSAHIIEMLWVGGLAATPVVALVAIICRLRSLAPATRHALWLAALLCFVTPMLGVLIGRPAWFRSDRLMQAADRAIDAAGAHAWSDTAASATPPGTPRPTTPPDAISGAARGAAAPSTSSKPIASSAASAAAPPSSAPVLSPRPRGDVQPTRSGPASVDTRRTTPAIAPVASTTRPAAASQPAHTARPRHGLPGPASAPPTARDHARIAAMHPAAVVTPAARPTEPEPRPPTTMAPEPSALTMLADRTTQLAPTARAWLAALLRVRDDLAALPPVPIEVWLAGVGVVLATRLFRTISICHALGRGAQPGPHTARMVRDVARMLGVARVPETVMSSATVSPLILCGWRPKLVLPTELWRTLDDDARRSILVHELAHLRRRDHVMHWVETIIGATYWWHPVVWWARRRLRDEAEASCDAWVTALLPGSRRAYAHALLTTKTYVSARERSAGPWIGVVSGRARRLARRITVVMTQRSAPKMSALGVCVATLVVGLGTVVTPGLACPPDESKSAKAHGHAEAARAEATQQRKAARAEANRQRSAARTEADRQRAAARAPRASTTRAPRAAAGDATAFFGEAPALEAMRGSPALAPTAPLAPIQPMPPSDPAPATAPVAPVAPIDAAPTATPAPVAPVRPRALTIVGQPVARVTLPSDHGPEIVREYRLPAGKLEALTELMARDDVPVYIWKGCDHIAVRGTAAQHETFGAFVALIHPGADAPAAVTIGPDTATLRGLFHDLQGQREALAERARTLADERRRAEEQRDRVREQLAEIVERMRDEAGSDDDRSQLNGERAALDAALASADASTSALDGALAEIEASLDAISSQAEALAAEIEAIAAASAAQLALVDAEDDADDDEDDDREDADDEEDGENEGAARAEPRD